MRNLFDVYCAVHNQGFIPIFVHDRFDSYRLTKACAGEKFAEKPKRMINARKRRKEELERIASK